MSLLFTTIPLSILPLLIRSSLLEAGVRRPAVATLTYVYADSTAVLGPLATYAEPHCYDLCQIHSERLTAPRGWEVVRLEPDPDALRPSSDDLEALADAVREAARAAAGRRVPEMAEVGRRGAPARAHARSTSSTAPRRSVGIARAARPPEPNCRVRAADARCGAPCATSTQIIKAYDVRGVVPDQLDDELAERVGAAFVRVVGRRRSATAARAPSSSATTCAPPAPSSSPRSPRA